MEIGDIVISLAGHDKDRLFVVTAKLNSEFVFIADGASRTAESPKLKRKRHLRVVAQSGLTDPTNAALKKRLKQYISDGRLYVQK